MNKALYDTLRKYYSNQLSLEEEAVLERRLEDDPIFAAEAAEYATIWAAIQQEGDHMLDAQLTSYAKELLRAENQLTLHTSNVRKLTARRRFLYAAAAVFLLLAIALPFWLDDRSALTPDEIFTANFTPPSVNGVRDGGYSSWQNAYDKGDYEKSIVELNTLLADNSYPYRSKAYLYKGISYLALDDPKPFEALEAFESVSMQSDYGAAAQWFSSMALFKLDKVDEAKKIINEIAGQPDHPFYNNAKSVQKELG